MKLKESHFDGSQIHRGYTDETDMTNPVMQLLLTEGISSVTIKFDNQTWRRYEFPAAGLDKPQRVSVPQDEPELTMDDAMALTIDQDVDMEPSLNSVKHRTWYNES